MTKPCIVWVTQDGIPTALQCKKPLAVKMTVIVKVIMMVLLGQYHVPLWCKEGTSTGKKKSDYTAIAVTIQACKIRSHWKVALPWDMDTVCCPQRVNPLCPMTTCFLRWEDFQRTGGQCVHCHLLRCPVVQNKLSCLYLNLNLLWQFLSIFNSFTTSLIQFTCSFEFRNITNNPLSSCEA